MFEKELKNIKIKFILINLLFSIIVIGGSFLLVNIANETKNYARLNLRAIKYELTFNQLQNKILTASIASIFNDNSFAIRNNDGSAKSIPVLLYHGIVENSDGSNVLLEDFKNQMFTLKKAGWQTVTLNDFYQFMQGKKELSGKSFLLTFDDGRKDSYYSADPLLKALDYNAVMFVITKYSLEDESGNYYLSKKELKRMAESGRWEIEAHTREGHNTYKISLDGKEGYYYSNKLWLDNKNRLETKEEFINRIKSDFISAKSDIEQGLGAKVISFAFPFGDYGQNSVNFPEAELIVPEIAKSIYSMAFYQIWPGKGYIFNYPNKDFLIKRIDVKPDWNTESLLILLDASREKPLPYYENFEKYNGWVKTWGGLTLRDNSMSLGATNLNNGGSIFLDGSRLWENYYFLTKIDWLKGKNVSLLARYKDDENYAVCNFSDDEVRIEQRLNNKNRVIVEVKHNSDFPKNDLWLGMKVNKDKIECLADGKIIAYTYYLSPVLSNGGIGFKIWDPEINNNEIIIKEVSIEEIK